MISTCGPPFGPHWCVAGVVSGGHDEYGDMVCPPAPTCSHVVNSIYLGRNNQIVNRKVECMRMTTAGDIILRDLLF